MKRKSSDQPYIDLGGRKWQRKWVSKQDLIEFSRCSYRVFLSITTGVPIAEMKETTLLKLLFEKGLEFESGIVQDIQPIQVFNEEEIEPLAKDTRVIQSPKIFRNHNLGIQGIPDLIRTGKGRFDPVEIKNHKEITDTDRLELAFYWLLLEPLRNKKVKPKGYIVLNTKEVVEVKLKLEDLWYVEFLLDQIRELLKIGAEPTLSGECKQCNQNKVCREKVISNGGLSSIYNISYRRQQQFKDVGIENISALMKVDENETNKKLVSKFGNSPGSDEIFRMKCHAISIRNGRPFFFGDKRMATNLPSLPILALDLEYEPGGLIWLVGVAERNDNQVNYHQFFAEKSNLNEERRILQSLVDIIKGNCQSVVTYSGQSADLPQLRAAWVRHNLPNNELLNLISRHIDIYQFILKSFRFPIKSLGLDDMGDYLGIQRNSNIANGMEALAYYKKYLRTKNISLKQSLLNYNKDDIESTLAVIDRIPQLVQDSIQSED